MVAAKEIGTTATVVSMGADEQGGGVEHSGCGIV